MIYLLRHGQTDYNRDRRVQGRLDSQLTALGRRQAAAMADLLAVLIDRPADWRLVASPAQRTRDTARFVADALGLAIETDPRLLEVHCGAWEGRLHAELAAEDSELFTSREWFFGAPGGETYADMMARVAGWLAEQAPEPERRLIVVSHGVAGRLLRGAYAGLERGPMMAQEIPQDAIFRLAGGTIERLPCPAVRDE